MCVDTQCCDVGPARLYFISQGNKHLAPSAALVSKVAGGLVELPGCLVWAGGLVGWLAAWLVGWLLGWLVGLLAAWFGSLVGCLVGWLAGGLAGWLVGWLPGWLVGCVNWSRHPNDVTRLGQIHIEVA